jgi:hypothetical protein
MTTKRLAEHENQLENLEKEATMTNQTQALAKQTEAFAKEVRRTMDKLGDNTHEKAAYIYTTKAAEELHVAANATTKDEHEEFIRRAIVQLNDAIRYLPYNTPAKQLRMNAKQIIAEDIEQPEPAKATIRSIEKALAKSLGF